MWLSEPGAAFTDLALGLVTLALASRLGDTGVNRYWRRAMWWAAAAALAGAVHHGFVTYSDTWAGPSWAVISGMVVVTISFVLAASVHDVLGPDRYAAFWLLRSLSIGAYVGLAAFGYYGVGTILACEGLTMVAILALWVVALWRHHPAAPAMVVALGASIVAGTVRALPPDVTHTVGLDPTSLYHVAQIPAIVLLYVALTSASGRRGPEHVRSSPAGAVSS
jgi:hypothetical protein